jgi:hypothetical protein
MHFARRVATVVRGRPALRNGQYKCDAARHGMPTACRQTLSQPAVDSAVWAKVSAILSHPDVIARELVALRENDPTATDVAAVDKMLTGVER